MRLKRHRSQNAEELLVDVDNLEAAMSDAPRQTNVFTAYDDVLLFISAVRQSAISGQGIGRDVLTRAQSAAQEYCVGFGKDGPGDQVSVLITEAIRADLVDTSPRNSVLAAMKEPER